MLKRAEADRHYFDGLPATDVFAFTEARLFQLINDAADKLKIGRSREHQAAVALRLWMREEIRIIVEALEHLQDILHDLSEKQAVSDDFFAAFQEMFARDAARFVEINKRVNKMPATKLDSAENESLAELDFSDIARELGFDSVLENSAESSSDRDFCLEFAHSAAFSMLHLSRLASASLPRFPVASNETGEVFEVLRGKAGKIFGSNMALLTILKEAPLAVSKDLQEINEIVFDAADTLKSSLQVTATILQRFELAQTSTS